MISSAEFTVLLIYLTIGIVITISVDALAIALIDEDVYGISDNTPSSSDWEQMLWKGVSVVVSPIVLLAFVATGIFLWTRKEKNGPKISQPNYLPFIHKSSTRIDFQGFEPPYSP